MVEADETFGFVVVDGEQSLMARVGSNSATYSVIGRYSVNLPRKHRRGGQSSARFQRLREQARAAYARRLAEAVVSQFADPSTGRPRVAGLVVGGAEMLRAAVLADLPPLWRSAVVAQSDLAYGGEVGLRALIERAAGALRRRELEDERAVLGAFLDHIACDTGRVCYGARETVAALAAGAVETLLLADNLPTLRVEETATSTAGPRVLVGTLDEIAARRTPGAAATRPQRFLDWALDQDATRGSGGAGAGGGGGAGGVGAGGDALGGCEVRIVSGMTVEGSMFARGFGGCAAILRWVAEFTEPDPVLAPSKTTSKTTSTRPVFAEEEGDEEEGAKAEEAKEEKRSRSPGRNGDEEDGDGLGLGAGIQVATGPIEEEYV